MPYRFVFTAWFDRNLKSLSKHNSNLRSDLEKFLSVFDAKAHSLIPRTGGARKARMAAKGKGSRGGYRVIYCFFDGDHVWLITIYDKVRKENLSSGEERTIGKLIQQIRQSEK